MSKPDIAPPIPPSAERWTRIDAYIGGLRRRRAGHSTMSARQHAPSDSPRMMLSTIPFAALIAVLGVLVIAFAVAAWPATQPEFKAKPVPREQGTAPPGWFDEAKKEFR